MLDIEQLYATLWTEKYAARYAAARAREEAFRAESWLSLPRLICGEPVRLMEPADLHLLDGLGNAHVCGREPLVFFDTFELLWLLHESNSGRATVADSFRRGLFRARFRRLVQTRLPELEAAVADYLDLLFLDAPPPSADPQSRPFGAGFLAPLLVQVAAALGPADPLLGRPWSRTPLPVVFQCLKVLRARDAARRDKDFVDRSPSDRLRSDCLAEAEQLARNDNASGQ